MASFSSSWVRPGVYVDQTTAISAPALPTSFAAAFIGHGSDRFTVSRKAIVSDGSSAQVLDAARNVISISSVSYKNQVVSSANYSVANTGVIPFGAANIAWSSGTPTAGDTYYVTYIAYKNPKTDFASYGFTEFSDFLSFYGTPSASSSEVLSETYVRNNMSLAAYIASRHGMGQFFGQQLNAFDESTTDTAATLGKVVGGSSPTTTLVGAAQFNINLNGDGVQVVSLAADATRDTGAEIATAVQAAVRALTANNSALQAAYDNFTCAFTTVYTVTSGMGGSNSSVVFTDKDADTTASAVLKVTAATGTPTAGTGPTFLDLTSEAGLLTSVTQALARLLLANVWAVIPLFPVVSGGVNTSLIAVIKAHIVAARGVTEKKWRVALLGGQRNSDAGASPHTKYITTQGVMGHRAMVYIAPSTCVFTYSGVDFTLDGWGVASAIGGIVSNPAYDAGEPLSGKEMIGFSSITDPFSGTQKSLMGSAGVLMIDSELGTPAIIMDLTTDQSSNVNSQLKFTRSGDYVSISLVQILRKLYINTRNIGSTTLASIKGSTKMILQQLASLHIINDFTDLQVSRDGIDARQININVQVRLTPDVSWILVSLSLSL